MFMRGPLERPECVPHAERGYNDFYLMGKKTQITLKIIPA